MNTPSPLSAAQRDEQDYLVARESTPQELLVYASRKSGLSVMQIMRDFKIMAASHSRLNMVEYVRHGLFDFDKHDAIARGQFISNDLHWGITHTCNNRGWSTVAEDKILAETILKAGGIPVPETVAVIDTSPRVYPGIHKIINAEALRDFVMSDLGDGLFGKIVDGMVSFGAFRIDSADETYLKCAGQDPVTYATFMNTIVAGNSYVVQRKLSNHAAFAKYCSAIATVRMVNLVTNDGVHVPLSIVKLPQGDNIADAFWRPGNLASEVDVTTGQVKTIALREGPEVTFMDDHPTHSGLMGLILPHWDEVIDINARAANLFGPIRYQSTDIAITSKGPVIVELNYGGGFDLPQYVSGRGMLTPKVRSFFEGFGYDFDAIKKKPSIIGRLFKR
jgi:hypothetical protein